MPTSSGRCAACGRAWRWGGGGAGGRAGRGAPEAGAPHLEGPFISEHRLGAQPPLVQRAGMERVRQWHALAPIRALTLAPEIDDHLALIPEIVALGIRVQLGHTAGSYEDGVKAMQAGASSFTHLFNGMTGMSHRAAGMACAALAHAEFAEIIPDLQHVEPGAMMAALRAIPKA